MLGWKVLKEHHDYKIHLPQLSEDEEKLILEIEDKFKETTREKDVSNPEEGAAMIRSLVLDFTYKKGIDLDLNQMEYLPKIAYCHIYGFGILDDLLKDREIEEISVIGINSPVYVFLRNKGWQKVNANFTTHKQLLETINKLAKNSGRRITLQNPRLDAMLANGARMHASLPPLSRGEITIRKFRDEPFSPKDLLDKQTIPIDALAILSCVMHSDSSLIIAGNTASGKTTTLNALFSFVPSTERIIITEETPEINIPHKHKVNLISNKEMGVQLRDLVYDSLRMRPDRMIVGEIRNKEECEALFEVLLAGQARGSYGTMHGKSVRETISRIRNFGIDELDLRSIDTIVVQRRMLIYDKKARRNMEVRRVVEISDLDGSFLLFNGEKYIYKKPVRLFEALSEKLGLNQKELEDEIEFRKTLIKKSPYQFDLFFKNVQKQLYGNQDV
ncbi:MAG: ATPase, T2SS/T4P/T4SS family [Candidatus Micrarchaeota archaeon]